MPDTAIPKTINLTLAAAISFAVILQCLGLPLFVHPAGWMVAAVLLLLPLNTPFWSLIHEAVHKNFHPDKRVNDFAGRAMSILFGASFHILRFGHLMHHQYNRDWESEYYQPGQNKILAWGKHYFTMLGGLYLSEVLLTFLVALCPRVLLQKIAVRLFPDERHQQAVTNYILKPETLFKIRIDTLCIVLFYAVSFLLFGQNWLILVLLLAGRALFVSLMDNAYHYGTPRDNSIVAKELKTSNLVSRFILNFNHHVTHHKNTRLPWTQLPEQHVIQNNSYNESLASALLEQFKGPLKADNS